MTRIADRARSARSSALVATVCALACALTPTALVSGCGGKKKDAAKEQAARVEAAASVEGLDALPADARVVVGANVPRLAASPLVKRAFAQMLARDAGLATRLAELQLRCKLDAAKDLDTVLVGLLGATAAREVVLVAKGRFDEAAIATCVEGALVDKGGALEKKTDGGMTIYLVKNAEGAADVAFTFGAKDVIILADSEALLRRARDPKAPKIKGDAEMMRLIGQTDARAALWGAGKVPPEVGKGLVGAAGGNVQQPASAIWGHVELGTGMALELALEMASAADAKALLDVVQKQLAQFSIVAQAYSMGPIVNKIKSEIRGKVFVVTLMLDAEELAKLETLLDRKSPSGDQELGNKGATP